MVFAVKEAAAGVVSVNAPHKEMEVMFDRTEQRSLQSHDH